jgi:dienelactone hydrolase
VMLTRRTIAGIPLLVAMPDRPHGGRLPLVLWIHGFNADANAHASELMRVAGAGFLAVGVDAVGHGERRFPDFDERKRVAMDDVRAFMMRLAAETAAELPGLVAALVEAEHADPDRVSLVGISMGGYLVYRALTLGMPIRAAVALLGSPNWPGYADSPHRDVAAFDDVALLSITAEQDESVPPATTRAFHAALAERPDRSAPAAYIELPGAHHLVSGDEWRIAMDATIDWLVAH